MSYKVIKVCDNENFLAAMLYVSSLVVIFLLSNIIIPLFLCMLKAKNSDFIEFHGKNVLNFQITILCLVTISMFTWIIFIDAILFFVIGAILFFAVIILDVVMMLKGAYSAYTGRQENIKYCYKFIK